MDIDRTLEYCSIVLVYVVDVFMNWKLRLKFISFSIGLGFLLGTVIVMIMTFMIAYFNPSKSVLVTINTYNEANFEFWMIMVCVPFTIYFVINTYKNFRNEVKTI
jgi:energy-coupling factor transporter transmembrane protein EcfT